MGKGQVSTGGWHERIRRGYCDKVARTRLEEKEKLIKRESNHAVVRKGKAARND
jgi:hypothetical protein